MMGTMQLYQPPEWSRSGRGRELQFFATDAEVEEWLGHLSDDYAPYSAWVSRLVRRNGTYQRTLSCFPLDEWLRAHKDGGQDVPSLADQFFLHAAAVMPALPTDEAVARHANEWASLNGLVLVQHGATRAGRQLASRVAVTDRIKNRSSGKVVSLKDRTVVFDALCKMIETELRFTSIQVFRDGHEEEDASQLMTAEAADLAAAGRFVRRPGRRIDP